MKPKSLLWNIRSNNVKEFILWIIPTLLIDAGILLFIKIFFDCLGEGQLLVAIFMVAVLVWLFVAYALDLNPRIINNIFRIFHPEKSTLFEKYGTIEDVCKLIDEMEKNVEYEDSKICISLNYFMKKNHYETMLYYGDIDSIKAVHHKYYSEHAEPVSVTLVIIDKWNNRIRYKINKKNSDYVTYLINGKLDDLRNGGM